jgi:hypothetical protein
MGWSTGQFQAYVPNLQALAEIKYDEYGNYGPGGKFIENLAGWLYQFPTERRQVALDFVMRGLVFISEAEMRQLISLVPSASISPVLRARVGAAHGLAAHRIAAIERHSEYAVLRRKSLVLGASDGARLDQLRRVSQLSHEQFLQTPSPSIEQLQKLARKLANALMLTTGPQAAFEHVFLVDDFSGSGTTLIRKQASGDGYEGKIISLRESLAAGAGEGLIVENVPGTVVLYCASEQALDQVRGCLVEMGLTNWSVEAVQILPYSLRVTERFPDMARLCEDLFDETSVDEDKGRTPIGFADCALPLVLSHNAPNNSVCLLWLDTREREGSDDLRALFPRYERHHPDRR